MWIQHVLVPGVTLRDDLLEKLAAFVATLRTVEHVELLPFHKLGEYKWQELGLDYSLADTPPATAEDVAHAAAIFARHGVRTV
jgi:pyruvate formate lyase activating enzyme